MHLNKLMGVHMSFITLQVSSRHHDINAQPSQATINCRALKDATKVHYVRINARSKLARRLREGERKEGGGKGGRDLEDSAAPPPCKTGCNLRGFRHLRGSSRLQKDVDTRESSARWRAREEEGCF